MRHHSEQAALTSPEKVRANLHRPALGDSRMFALEEVTPSDTRHPAQVLRLEESRNA
ncbi:hypothetical protein ACINK0_15595 [Deinococcus sp. VB343]|uniref:hypothetical protein n=1 Tax=Deinococcus sp. VB343 TaxID=3385567 RepID=UPI0039C91B44